MPTLYSMVSALTALAVFVAWVRPCTFVFLIDKRTGHPSIGRQGQYTALLVSTWVLVTVALDPDDRVSEWLFIGYMVAWAGAQFGSRWMQLRAMKPNDEEKKE